MAIRSVRSLLLNLLLTAFAAASVAGCAASRADRSSEAAPPPPATQTCPDGSIVAETEACPPPPPPPPPPPDRIGERDDYTSPPPPPPPAPTANGGGETYTTCEGLRDLTLSPPRPSTPLPYAIRQSLFAHPGATLGHVRDKLESALDGAGYEERGSYCVRNGFALVTRLERIDPVTKAPLPPQRRWNTNASGLASGFSLRSIIQALTQADPGTYRVLIFYITDQQVTPTAAPPSAEFGRTIIEQASDELPAELETRPYTTRHRVRVLVYEFRRPSAGAEPALLRQTAPPTTHLNAAGILQRLR